MSIMGYIAGVVIFLLVLIVGVIAYLAIRNAADKANGSWSESGSGSGNGSGSGSGGGNRRIVYTCPPGYMLQGSKCYEDCPAGDTSSGTQCISPPKSIVRSFVGPSISVPIGGACPAGSTKSGGLCIKCPADSVADGMLCYVNCPAEYMPAGAMCNRPAIMYDKKFIDAGKSN